MTHQSLDDQSIQLFQDLPFEIVAVPHDNDLYSNMMLSGNVYSPVNIKIRYKNKEVTGAKRGVISVPRLGANQNSKKLRLIKSDQTIISFDLLVNPDKNKTCQKKYQNKILKIFKTGCFSTHNDDDDEYTYLPSSSVGDNKIPEITNDTNDVTADKFALRKNFSSDTRKIPIFLGKCKPGGCLDPPFNEDKYSYEPATKLSITSPKREDNQILDQEFIPNRTINETDIITKTQNDRKNKIFLQSKLDSKVLEQTFSDLIITYPPALSSSEIEVRKASQNSATKAKISCEKKSKQSINEFTEIFYKPLKREKSKNFVEPYRIHQDETSYNINKSIDNSLNSQSQRKISVSVPQNLTPSNLKISTISLPKDKETPTAYSTITQVEVEKSITSLEKLTPILETKIDDSRDITEFCSLISKNPEKSLELTNKKITKSEISVSKETLITQDEVKSSIFLVLDVTSTTTIETNVLEIKEDDIKSVRCLSLQNKETTADDNQKNLMPTFDIENKSFENHDNINVRNYSLSTQNQEILPLSINEKRKSDIDKENGLKDKFAKSYEHFVSIQDKTKTSTHQFKISKSSSNIERKSSDNLFTISNHVKLSASLSKALLDNEIKDLKSKDSLLIHENSFIIQKENILPSFDMKLKYNIEEIPIAIEKHENCYDIQDAMEEILNNILKHIKTNVDDPISNITLSSNNITKVYSSEFHSNKVIEHTQDTHQSREFDNIDVLVKENDVKIKQKRCSSNILRDYVKNSESIEDIINKDTSQSENNEFCNDVSTLNNINTLDIQVENIIEETEELSNNKVQTNKSIPAININSMIQTLQNKEENPVKDIIQNQDTITTNNINTIFSKENFIPLLNKNISIKSLDKINLNGQNLEENTNLSDLKYYKTTSLSLRPIDVVLKNQEAKIQRGDNVNDIYAPTDLMISNNKNNTTKIKSEFLDRPLSKIESVSHLQKQAINIYKDKVDKNYIGDPKYFSEKPNTKYSEDFPINFSKSGSCIETTVMNNNELLRKLDTPEIEINFRFVYRINEKNDLVLQTCDPIHPISANTNKKEAVLKTIIRKYDDEIRIPLNSQTDLTLEIKKTNNSEKPKEHLCGVKVPNGLLLQETLNTVYQNLLSLQIMIRNLREEAKSLSQQQVLIKELLASLETKPERLVDHKGRCKCHKI